MDIPAGWSYLEFPNHLIVNNSYWNFGLTYKSNFTKTYGRYIYTHMCHGAGIFTYICPNKYPGVGADTIHGTYG